MPTGLVCFFPTEFGEYKNVLFTFKQFQVYGRKKCSDAVCQVFWPKVNWLCRFSSLLAKNNVVRPILKFRNGKKSGYADSRYAVTRYAAITNNPFSKQTRMLTVSLATKV